VVLAGKITVESKKKLAKEEKKKLAKT